MWNLCCSGCVKNEHVEDDLSGANLTMLLLRIFLRLTFPLWFSQKIVNTENISLLKVG
ncbi:conserved protein of unknown function [Enterobacter cancerogenus]|nr:conserved protein of unknown function [Enterobacter cancerogenus]